MITAGSSGMAQSPSASSTQYSVMYNLTQCRRLAHWFASRPKAAKIVTFAPAKEFQSLVVSSPELANGSTYILYLGGKSSGTPMDGLYSDGSYSAGIQVASFTISNVVTTLGAAGGFGPGGGGPGGGGMPPGGGGPPP
ncbi:MAG: hypothetical protein IPG44_17920 [Anaerolineales bacterium]|nr:hypothetical protein [Anaerolineales bacterium]